MFWLTNAPLFSETEAKELRKMLLVGTGKAAFVSMGQDFIAKANCRKIYVLFLIIVLFAAG